MTDLDTSEAPALHRDAAPSAKGVDPLVRYMIFHWVLGALLGALFATALLIFDPFGLRPLMHDSGMGAVAAFMLYVGFMTSFGGLVCAAAVMFPPDDDEPPRGGLRGNVMPGAGAPAGLCEGIEAGLTRSVRRSRRPVESGALPAPFGPRRPRRSRVPAALQE